LDNIIPNNFINALAGLIIIVSLIISFLSLIPSIRSHSIKLLALFLVASLSLFSNHWTTYFASIFVIATAVTELEFLQNLAAIIRGNKDYFDYKKESLSSEQKTKKIEEEIQELESDSKQTTEEQLNIHKVKSPAYASKRPDLNRIYELETKALDKLEEYFGKKIERGLRIRDKINRIELDGLIPSVVDDVDAEILIEVKYLRDNNINRIKHVFPQIENIAIKYNMITNKIAKLHLVLIIEGTQTLNEEQVNKLKKIVDSSKVAMGYSVYTSDELLSTHNKS